MNVIKLRNQKIDRVKKYTFGIRYNNPMWVNCNIRMVSSETFYWGPMMRDHITVTEKPTYQKINYLTITAFCDGCEQCVR